MINSSIRKKSVNGNVKLTTCGHVVELMDMERVNRKGSSIIQVDKDHYYNLSDFDYDTGEFVGELKKFNRTENRGQNYSGMRKSMKAVRDLINCNVTDPSRVRWMTFTYAENMRDSKRLYNDRGAFWKRVIRWHKKMGLLVPEYICIAEPQGRGAWHLHELWLYPDKAPYLPNDVIAGLWEHGFVTVKKLDDVDNVGAYVTAYLCDVPEDEAVSSGMDINGMEVKEVEITLDDGTKQNKKYVKGARLHLYPSKMNFYRTSRGIKRPIIEWIPEKRAKEKVSGGALTYSKTIRMTDDDYSNDIHYEYYNMVRGKNQ